MADVTPAAARKTAIPKIRSRKDGAAIPLDDTDKRLLNLLQGSFPIARRPFAAIAELAGLGEDEVLARTRRLLDKRIIREITPIFDTRALGYESMLVAAKVDAEHPQRAAQIVNAHPGVSHNYLRTHEFNLWFTIATAPDSELGLDKTLDVIQELTGAESIRRSPPAALIRSRIPVSPCAPSWPATPKPVPSSCTRNPRTPPVADPSVTTTLMRLPPEWRSAFCIASRQQK